MVEKTHLKEGEVVNEVNNEYDIGNRLIRSNEKKFSYDDDGNQIKAGDMSFGYMTSHVNGNNVKRLKSVYKSTDHVASYSYTLEGLRTGKYLNSGESEVSFHYSGKNVIYEQWSNGRTVRYTHPSTGSSCSSCGCGNKGNVFTDHPISIETNGSKYYYLYNGQGSVTELINANEEVVNKYRYTPFGSPRLKAESVYNPYQYTERRLDEETGQYYYRARMYSAQQCRFTTQDPSCMQNGPNMYAYVRNNPVNKRDPTGLMVSAGSGSNGEIDFGVCPGDYRFDTFWECFDEYDDRGYDFPGETCTTFCYPAGGLPSFTIDDQEFENCLTKQSAKVAAAIGCIVGAVPTSAYAIAAISGGFSMGDPEPISKAVSGAVSLAAIGAISISLAACGVGGKALEVTYCGIKALRWE